MAGFPAIGFKVLAVRARQGEQMRWLWLLIAIFGFGVAFSSKTAGVLTLGLFVGLVGLFAFAFAMAAARIAENAQPASSLIADAEVSRLRASANQKKNARLSQPESAQPLSSDPQ